MQDRLHVDSFGIHVDIFGNGLGESNAKPGSNRSFPYGYICSGFWIWAALPPPHHRRVILLSREELWRVILLSRVELWRVILLSIEAVQGKTNSPVSPVFL